MKTAEVRILPAPDLDESAEKDFLLVETLASPQGEETSINRVLRKGKGDADERIESPVATSLTATHKVAIEWATAFAALNEIPVVYERRDED